MKKIDYLSLIIKNFFGLIDALKFIFSIIYSLFNHLL